MSIRNTTEQINAWIEELNAMTGVVYIDQVKVNPEYDPEKPVGPDNEPYFKNPSYDPNQPIADEETGEVTNFPYQTEQVPVNGAFSCERLQEIVDLYVQQITDQIASAAQSIANIMSTWAPLLSLPSDPMKILKWASKVVGGPIAAQIALIVEIVIDIAQLVSALANLISAVAAAIAKLIACLESQIFNAFNVVINSIYQNAANLIATAEILVDSIVANALEATGAQDLLDEIDAISDQLGTAETAVTQAVTDAVAAKASIDAAGTQADRTQQAIELDKLSLQTRLESFDTFEGTVIPTGG